MDYQRHPVPSQIHPPRQTESRRVLQDQFNNLRRRQYTSEQTPTS